MIEGADLLQEVRVIDATEANPPLRQCLNYLIVVSIVVSGLWRSTLQI